MLHKQADLDARFSGDAIRQALEHVLPDQKELVSELVTTSSLSRGEDSLTSLRDVLSAYERITSKGGLFSRGMREYGPQLASALIELSQTQQLERFAVSVKSGASEVLGLQGGGLLPSQMNHDAVVAKLGKPQDLELTLSAEGMKRLLLEALPEDSASRSNMLSTSSSARDHASRTSIATLLSNYQDAVTHGGLFSRSITEWTPQLVGLMVELSQQGALQKYAEV